MGTCQGMGKYLLSCPTNKTSIVIARTLLNLHSWPLDGWQLTKQSGSDTRGPACHFLHHASQCGTSNQTDAYSHHVINTDPFLYSDTFNNATNSPLL